MAERGENWRNEMRRSDSDRGWQDRSSTNRYSRRFTPQGYSRDPNSPNYDLDINTTYDYGSENDQPTTWIYKEWWLIPGPFSGVGPRGYQRSDELIREDACERLSQHGQVDASDIEVDVHDQVVTLRGEVDSRQAKRLAEDTVDSVSGVRDIHNEIRVRQLERTRVRSFEGSHERANENLSGVDAGNSTGTMTSTQMSGATTATHSTGSGTLQGQVWPGMEVVSSDGKRIGNVKEVREQEILVDRPMARDMYVPISACTPTDVQVKLHINESDVDKQDWAAPHVVHTPDLPD